MNLAAYVHMYPPMHNAGAEHMLHAILSEAVTHGHSATVVLRGPLVDESMRPYTIDGVAVTTDTAPLHAADAIITHLDRTTDACEFGRPVVHIVHNHRTLGVFKPKRADLVVYNTRWLAERVAYDAPSVIVTPPIFSERYATEPGDAVTLINLCAEKGAALFYALAEAMPDVRFLGVRGAYGEQMPAPKLKNLRIIDTQKDVRRAYSETAVLLMPSAYESYGRCAMEAACSGIPTIAASTPGLTEALGDAGVFPEDMSVEAWEAALRTVIDDLDAFGMAAYARAAALDPEYDVARLLGAIEATCIRQAPSEAVARARAALPSNKRRVGVPLR